MKAPAWAWPSCARSPNAMAPTLCSRTMPSRMASASRCGFRLSPYDSASTPIVARKDRAVFHAHRKGRDRFRRRSFLYFARAHVEACAVARAFHLEAAHFAARQVAAIMGASILDRVQVALQVVHRNRGVAVPDDLEFARQQFVARTHAHPSVVHGNPLARRRGIGLHVMTCFPRRVGRPGICPGKPNISRRASPLSVQPTKTRMVFRPGKTL